MPLPFAAALSPKLQKFASEAFVQRSKNVRTQQTALLYVLQLAIVGRTSDENHLAWRGALAAKE